MKQRIITLIALLCALAGTAGATTKTYTVTGGQDNLGTGFYALFSDGSTSSGQVNWTYDSTAEISFSLPGGLTLKLSNTAKQLVYNNGAIGGRGSTTLTVSSTTYYIYRVRLLDSSGNVIQLNANGEAVNHDGVSECDYWNMTKSFSHTFSNGILFSKIEVSYATAIPITDAVITGLSSQYPVSNTAIMPTPTVTWHGTTLTLGTHCTISYLNNTAAGTATVTATGKGIFSSSTSVSANYTLVWATYSVRFNKNNDAATGTMSDQPFTYNTAKPLTANAFSRTGYTFAGWNRAANGSGTSYTDQQEVQNLTATNGGTVDLYAQWTANTYTLRLHHNDGTEAYTDMTMTYDQAQNIQSVSPRTGYTFTGWKTAPDGDVVYTDGQEVLNLTATNGGTVDLYAQWTAITYSITYDLAGGTVATANPTSYSIESNNFTLANPTRTGYTFAGWTGTDLNEPTMEVTIPTGSFGDRTYTATWTDSWGMADGADGSEEHPYVITTTAGLDLLATRVNSGNNYQNKYFVLDSDITYTHTTDWNNASSTENNYTPIGGYFNSSDRSFRGTFDGQDHTVSGIRIYKGGSDYNADSYLGLFGRLYNGGVVKNVTVSDMRITGYSNVGGIVGWNNEGGSVENCHATATVCLNAVQGGACNFGGIVGYNYRNDISSCTSAVTITVADNLTGCQDFGGIVGTIDGDESSVSNCLAVGVAIPDISIKDYDQHDVTASGAIAGCFYVNSVLSNNYYSDCTLGGTSAASGIGVGYDNDNNYARHDVTDNDGAMPGSLHTLTLGENITATGALLNEGGTIRVPAGSTVTLNYSGLSADQIAVFSLNGNELDGNTFAMSATDATVSASVVTAWGTDKDADGSENHPYVITRTQELNLLAECVNSGNSFQDKYFVLDSDITYHPTTAWNDATSTENNFTAIGGNDGYRRFFCGTFDGQGHTVSGIRIYKGGISDADCYQGLFSFISEGVVKNVTVSDMRITGYSQVGGIVGENDGESSVVNCHATATVCLNAVQNNAWMFGGIAGNNGGYISYCTSAAAITLTGNLTDCQYFGGIVGFYEGRLFEYCRALGVAIPNVPFSGAIVGYLNSYLYSEDIFFSNYYSGCTLGGTQTASGIGVGGDNYDIERHDVMSNNGAVPYVLELADYAGHNSTVIDNSRGEFADIVLSNRTLYRDGDWNTLCLPFSLTAEQIAASPLAGWTLMELDIDAGSYVHITGFENSALYLNFKPATSIEAGTPYIARWNPAQSDLAISSEEEWNAFCESVNDGTSYAGKVVKLAADISVSTMAGTYDHPFEGTFNGDGHTLTVTLNNDGQSGDNDESYGVAPFRFTHDAVIMNLHVGGTITTSSRKYAAGIVGMTKDGTNSIQNCRVSTEIYSTIDGDGTHGGFVGKACGEVNISNCLFDGVLTTDEGNITHSCGGFVGWRDDPCSLDISNSLYAPAALPNGKYAIGTNNSCTFTRNNDNCVSDCYYTQTLGEAQGDDASAMSNDQLLTALGDGWQISSGKVVPTKGNVPDITNPVFYGVTIDNVNPETRTVVSQDGKVSFTGTYDAMSFAADNRSILFLGAGNTLYYPQTGANINAFRAYFQLNGISASDLPAGNVKMFFGEGDDTDGLTPNPSPKREGSAGAWYTIDGRRVSGKPTQKGIYVNNGRKVVMK